MERSNKIVEMEKGSDGSYHANQIVRRPQRIYPSNWMGVRPTGRMGKFHEFLGGFIIGLDAIERFFEAMTRGGYRR